MIRKMSLGSMFSVVQMNAKTAKWRNNFFDRLFSSFSLRGERKMQQNPRFFELNVPFVRAGSTDENNVVNVTVARHSSEIQDWFQRALDQDTIYGVDLEWKPSRRFSRIKRPTALIQISNLTDCLLIQTQWLGENCAPYLRDFLWDPSYTKVGVNIHFDMAKLEQDFKLFTRGCLDIGLLARYCEMFAEVAPEKPNEENSNLKRVYTQLVSLETLCRELCGYQLPKEKSVSLSDWEKRHLSPKQLRYAALDAIASREVYKQLTEQIEIESVKEKVVALVEELLLAEYNNLVLPSSLKSVRKAARIASVSDQCFDTFVQQLEKFHFPEHLMDQVALHDPRIALNTYVQVLNDAFGELSRKTLRRDSEEAEVALLLAEGLLNQFSGPTVTDAKKKAAERALKKLLSDVGHPSLHKLDEFLPEGRLAILPIQHLLKIQNKVGKSINSKQKESMPLPHV